MASNIEVTAELLAGFLDEAEQFMSILNANLLTFEGEAENGPIAIDSPERQEWMNEMFRAAHSLKGLGATMGFERIKDVTHLMETLFDRIRMGQSDLDSQRCETLFVVFDCLQRLIDELTTEVETPVDIQPVLDMLEKELSRINDPSNDPPNDQNTSPSDSTNESVEKAQSGEVESPAVVATEGADILVLTDPQLRKLFIDTTTEAIDVLNEKLLSLEENSDADTLNEIFRMAHNIKGACGAAGLEQAYGFTHEMETVLDKLRTAQIEVDEQLMTALFGAADALREVIEVVKTGSTPDGSRLDRSVFANWAAGSCDDAEQGDGTSLDANTSEDSDDNDGLLSVTVTFPPEFAEAEIQAYLILNRLKQLGDVLGCEPDIENATGADALETVRFQLDPTASIDEIREAVGKYQVKSVSVESASAKTEHDVGAAATPVAEPVAEKPVVEKEKPASQTPPPKSESDSAPKVVASSSLEEAPATDAPPVANKPTAAPQKVAAQRATPVRTGETIRVDIERLDQLMNLGGELVICRARLNQTQNSFTSIFDGRNLRHVSDAIAADLDAVRHRLEEDSESVAPQQRKEMARTIAQARSQFETLRDMASSIQSSRAAFNDFAEAVHVLGRVSDGLQKGIMDTRMVPVGPLFTRFKRVVRDLAKAKGKRINLELVGEATELDKRMIDELGDPLTHMVRNSVDHGLETPEDRQAAGKNPTGTIVLEAYHSGNSICIRICDDGRGIDHEAVRAKAVERQILTAQQAEAATPKELVQLVFQPGFSTAKQVSDLSGRGMGMDIVMNKLNALNGTVEIDTTPGEGSIVTIRLPLTLAIINALLVRVGDGVFAIPIESVAEIITARHEDMKIVQRRRVVRVRENVVPVVRFEEVFDLPSSDGHHDSSEETLCIIGAGEQRIGLSVDHLVGQEDVVIKSLAENYQNVRGFAGASIMGDGRVCMILDVAAVLDLAREAPPVTQTRAVEECAA